MINWFKFFVTLACLFCGVLVEGAVDVGGKKGKPNVVIIFADDMGYGDLGCYGNAKHATPNLDAMAKAGMRFTDFHVAQAVCGASRAALLSGCYPNRIGFHGAPDHSATHGINGNEWLMPEMLKAKGYATAVFGKWHLGHHFPFLPKQNGFDEYFGLPYSNDMWPAHPQASAYYPKLPLMRGNNAHEFVESLEDQAVLTKRYTQRAVDFIKRKKSKPFFLYLTYAMPHVPLAVSKDFRGKSQGGMYGDVIEEIDWSVGEVLKALKEQGVAENTLVIFLSDNGPWLSYGNHGGSAGRLREGKGTTFEGGTRVPMIAMWPGKIKAGQTNDDLAMTIDLLPTLAGLTGGKLSERKIDGVDIWGMFEGKKRKDGRAYYFYYNNDLKAVRLGAWKLHFPHTYRTVVKDGGEGKPGKYNYGARQGLALYDLKANLGEDVDVAAKNPVIMKRLEGLADGMRKQLGDSLRKMKGNERRLIGRIRGKR